jgi:hypothetical protein
MLDGDAGQRRSGGGLAAEVKLSLDIDRIRAIRIEDAAVIERAAADRSRRPLSEGMLLIAADHPARGSLAARGRADAMADREDLLERLAVALDRPGVDGVLGTPDVIEDLLLLGALEDKVVVGSMNRGGLAGSVFELDDRYTAYDADSIAAMGFEGGKMLVRIDLEDPATVRTLEHTAHAVSGLAAHGLMALVEPFMSHRRDGKVVNDLSPDAVIKSMGIASGLGNTSRHTWLKLPVVDEMERVMRATTMPTLLLGGDPKGSDDEVFTSWEKALGLPGVRGLVVGRALLYPHNDDVAGAVDIAAGLVAGA